MGGSSEIHIPGIVDWDEDKTRGLQFTQTRWEETLHLFQITAMGTLFV